MEIYPLGYLIIPLGIVAFLWWPRFLYALIILSIPFTGTAIFKLANGSFEIQGIRASLFLGFLGILRELLRLLFHRIEIDKSKGTNIITLLVLVFVILSSLIMPVLINGDLEILDAYSGMLYYAEPIRLYFKFQYFTQTIYFCFGCLFACYIGIKNNNVEEVNRTIKLYLYATIFVCVWGLFELFCFTMKIQFPVELFNQNSMNWEGPLILNGKIRIMSVALEPSILAQQLITAIPLIYWLPLKRNFLISEKSKNLILGLFVLLVALTRSSTAIFGLIAFIFLIAASNATKGKTNKYILYGSVVGIVLIALSLSFFWEQLALKLQTFSGEERLKALENGWSYFSTYPILGIGWGVFPTWDFLLCVGVGSGVVGISVFFILFRNLIIAYKNNRHLLFNKSIANSLLMLVLVSQFSGFIYHSQYFWLILGLALGAFSIQPKEKSFEKNE